MNKSGLALRGFAQRWIVFVGLIVVWEIAATLSDDVFFPVPSEIAATGFELWFSGPAQQLFLSNTVFEDIVPSMIRLLSAWLIASAVGIAAGLALGRSKTAMDYVGPLFAFARAIPSPALVPVFLVLFGIGTPMQMATIIFGVIWPVLLNAVDGAQAVDQTKVETARSFRIPYWQWMTMVVLPSAGPKIFAGLRVALSLSLVLMVISELVGSVNGIGYQLISAQRLFRFDETWAWIVLLGVLGYVFNTVLLAVERRVLGWQQAQDAGISLAKTGG
ncbi:ABC transporter permease [Actinoalloteichus hymeniacidonis]|uniref:ABC-type nitrate/sulfonate/bicarbonate transport system, permease component n=1 Tax=Actinoalloteichus hymeniacidonis TaxID=340345 RepID=A0AAC9HVC9_9PSEU|nr:ABC transporter permease [Actinoalloteichus hymeniacidonis]AOS65846.1 ABC-type nitrate/sulfonate/bicarbonate transport system, permease component [Actinoalloteichus hymeniacidonis]MBB5906063.1 ABC-type nitrate/sulfonate/bicarbonate transport system permease component [Actinoalloteichus hymeniacidonis]